MDSTALILLLIDRRVDFEAIFVDNEVEYPETYSYVEYINEKVHPITVLRPKVEGFHSLYKFCMHHKTLPSVRLKWCNDKFKMRPQAKYRKRPCTVYLGFNADEMKRAKGVKPRKGETYKFPLIEEGLTKRECISFIKDHGLKVPIKSGCYFCPMQSPKEWKKLMVNHSELYKKAILLEENAQSLTFFMDGSRLTKYWQDNKLTNYVPEMIVGE